ncbi:hypothetical protein FB45DRAFT_999654 [Roridomyces roridus]|uniref:DUF6535 domain-containing protein n=1 Tax=Roridomyces roridus TaxID=1738132 RepID=A0AAD7CC83_9AGAR|nr:hypothetical protein FB45DRAFT_999654 [Roridomyces roridus]
MSESSHERVPNELWIEIFGLLPRDSLKNVYSTAKKFTTASRALLFSHLVFHYYYRREAPSRDVALPASDDIQSGLDRLAFWSSDEIAPFVRECTIGTERQHLGEAEFIDSPDILLASFMDALGRFTGLKKLFACRVKFTPVGLVHLCRIPLLTEIVIEGCEVVTDETVDTTILELRTTKLVYRNSVVANDDRNFWLTIVHRGHLRELEATGSVSAVSNTLARGATFLNVDKLRLAMNFSTMTQNLVVLSKFPAVCALQLGGWGQIEYEPSEQPAIRAVGVLPLLKEYRGASTPLHLFLPKPTLTRLVIDVGSPEELTFQLRGEYGHITTLHTTVHDLDRYNLSTICRCLPALIELRVSVLAEIEDGEYSDFNRRATDFFADLEDTPGLPPTLQRLAISWEFEFESDEDEDTLVVLPEMIPDFFVMRDKLRERCPAPRTLWFDGYDFMFRWRQLLDREEVLQEQNYEDKKAQDPRTDEGSSEEAAATKLWAVYVSEAEKYDKALVESWKSDMEGMLIFPLTIPKAGLFSASLTAFIIESYPTLLPDSGDTTVQLLAQISQQLAAAANGSTFLLPQRTPAFAPPTASLVCNSFWFVSLGLSLSCALVATLVEQWARDFLHKADMRSAPATRARIFSYLYYGLKRFSMHTVVDIIPLLLHASLLFFFAGLVAFLVPINIPMAVVAAPGQIYSTLGYILTATNHGTGISRIRNRPAVPQDTTESIGSRYFPTMPQTIRKRLESRFMTVRSGNSDNQPAARLGIVITAVMAYEATQRSPQRIARDYQALAWTVRSLADETELEPFIEAIPDVLWGPTSPRRGYRNHVQNLLRDPNAQLLSRLQDLLRSCDTGVLSTDAIRRRRIIYYKALWAIGSLPVSPSDQHILSEFPQYRSYSPNPFDFEWEHYRVSIAAMAQWSVYLSAKSQVPKLLQEITHLQSRAGTLDVQPIMLHIQSWWIMGLPILSNDGLWGTGDPASLVDILEDLSLNVPHRLLFRFLRNLGWLKLPSYRWRDTQAILLLNSAASFSAWEADLELALETAVSSGDLATPESPTAWVDTIVQELSSYWTPPSQSIVPRPIPNSIIYYFDNRQSDEALKNLLGTRFAEHMWKAYPVTLAVSGSAARSDVLRSLWRVAFLSEQLHSHLESALSSVINIIESQGTSPLVCSVHAMLKDLVLRTCQYVLPDGLSALQRTLLTTETRNGSLELIERLADTDIGIQHFEDLVTESRISSLADFLEDIHASPNGSPPYKMIETLQRMGKINPPRAGQVHNVHQIRLAAAITRLCQNPVEICTLDNLLVMDAILAGGIFDKYAEASGSLIQYGWLDDIGARRRIKETLEVFNEALASYPESSLGRVRAIIAGLDW